MLSTNLKTLLFAIFFIASGPATLYARGQTPFSKISSVYSIKFAGFSIGTLKYLAKTNGSSFNMKSLTHVSLLGGIASFNWKWTSNNSGRVRSTNLRPDVYNVDFVNGGKRQSWNLKFSGTNIKELNSTPKYKYPPENIKLRSQHQNGVIDPLSAFIMPTLVKSRGGSPCNQNFKLFDGKLRFDLVMKPKRQVELRSKARGAYRGPAHVCSARWIPIAGHDPNDSTNKYMAANKTIEVYMVPVEGYDRYFAPYNISFSTPFGNVGIRSVYMEVTTLQNKVISMLNK